MKRVALLLLLSACSADPDFSAPDPGGSRPDAGVAPRPDASTPPRTSAAIEGFALDVHAGDWWQFQYDESWQGNTKTSVYRFVLDGPARVVNGFKLFKLRAEGGPYGPDLGPPWTYLAFGAQ